MRKSLYLILPMLFASTVALGQGNPKRLAGSPCNEYYEAAIKFIIDTPVLHLFSISATEKVIFSSGNLQYQANTDTWRFAINQYDYCGLKEYDSGNVYWDSLKADGTHVRIHCNNILASNNYGGWIDLFAWGTSGHGRKAHDSLACHFYPWEFIDSDDYLYAFDYNEYGLGPSYAEPQRATLNPSMSSDFDDSAKLNRYFDWGFYNNIREYSKHSSGDGVKYDSTMYFTGVWRTPTQSEWI